jgi:hypothetical protein
MLVGTLNYNQLNPSYLALGSLLSASIGSPQAIAANIGAPYPGFQGSVAQALRPFPQFQDITLSSDPIGNNTYNALQIRLQKRYSSGLSFLLTYTLSKDLTDADGNGGGVFLGGAQNYYNLRAEKAVAAADVPQAFTAGYAYDLPFGSAKRFKTGQKLFDKYVLGNWITSGIVTLQNGAPLAIGTQLSLPGIGPIRPDVVSSTLYGQHSRGSFDPATDVYLNAAAFAPPAPFSFGNAPRQFSQIRSFGTVDWDAVLQKSIPIHERLRFALKAEFFNVLNSVNFGAPDTNINSPTFGRIFSANPARTGQISGTVYW